MAERSARVTDIPIVNIKQNPHNPRRLFDEEPMAILKKSIQELGILVPLDVYPQENKHDDPRMDTFILLDGERRWRCAREIGLKKVPCIVVATPTEERNILTMFHIHNVRVGWQLMPTALTLKELMVILGTTNERELTELTKLSISQVRRCKILLTYPEPFQLLMLAPPTERYKADFFIDLHRIRGPALEKKFPPWTKRGDEKCIEIMIDKYDRQVIRAVTEFRRLVSVYRSCENLGREEEFMAELDRFFEVPDRRIDDIDIPGATFAIEARELGRSTRRLLSQIRDIDLENLSEDTALINDLSELATLIRGKLEDALLIKPTGNNDY